MGQTAYVDLHGKSCRRKHRAPSHELLHIVGSKLQRAGKSVCCERSERTNMTRIK